MKTTANAPTREFHLHVTFITEPQKYLAVYSIQLILQGDLATFREFPLRSTADKSMCLHSQPLGFKGLSELTRLAELTCKLRLHVPGWLKNALRLKMHNTRKIVAKFLLIYNGLYIACYDFLTYRRKF